MARTNTQPSLFDTAPALPEGLKYQRDLISPAEEHALAEHFAALPFEAFDFHGFKGHRRVIYFGWRYDFSRAKVEAVAPIPEFLRPLRDRAAEFASVAPDDLAQVLINQYPPGAGIGWHRDRPQFGKVVGVSLLSAATMRLRRKAGDRWERASFVAEPCSAYLFDGPARDDWQHSINPGETLRYSATFRTLRPGFGRSGAA